ncbi:MAG: Lrp/AsnC ligand binding domain-containing protein [Paludibacteraceae bacterium]|jgi:Lrp/AsnC family transcriptional regulator for asnA, asnC and gidA|nr:Lrp/AsnC ligand binding domain-containing protein [Paludibacteraceae bacterium]MBR6310482.1 Lrp/AsnC ligand binding domain-containing protein [Paludibacteraceae bacterium]MDD6357795.1 Lrp/AsnC ligand binding domain-containing protein [Bacteroidales bacterium]
MDKIDLKILQIISENARIPYQEVGDACGISRTAVHQRVQKMFDEEVLTGSGYKVDPHKLGYQVCTYIGIKLEKASKYKEVLPELNKIPELVECHFTTGPYTLLVKLYARDTQHLMQLLNGQIQEIPGVSETETLMSLDESINRTIQL